MKKFLLVFLPLFFMSISAQAVLISAPNTRAQFVSDFISVNGLTTIEDYVNWLPANIRYQKDGIRDEWADPQTTVNRGVGDCEDLAFLNQAVLKHLGYFALVLSVRTATGTDHAICVYLNGGTFQWIDNYEVIQTTTGDFYQFLVVLLRHYKATQLFELEGENGSQHIFFQI